MATSVIVPIIHLNGTSKQMLLDDLENAYYALNKAYAAIKETGPNGRDYYPVPGLMEKAVEQHMQRLKAVDAVKDSIAEQMTAISNQGARS